MTIAKVGLASHDFDHLKSAIDEAAIVAITDAMGVITYVNKQFCQISQYSSDELIGGTHQIINSRNHTKEFFADMWRTISSGRVWEGELCNRAKDGSFYWVNTTIVPFMDEQGRPEKYVAVRYDITERKLAEEKLIIYAKELKESQAQVLQQDRLASLGLLASSLAHEIGTPLGIIRSRAEMASKKPGNETIKQDMDTVISQIDRIAKLVHSLLNLARERRSDFGGSVNLSEVIKDILNLVQHELARKGISLLGVGVPDTFVRAEAGPLGQVLLNLLVNSVHAIEEAIKSGRKINHTITISVDRLEDSVEISLRDTGAGISPKNLLNLFKPFFTTKDIGQGTGLGLATSYKLVQSWSGSISADSVEGEGSVFKIKLLKATRR